MLRKPFIRKEGKVIMSIKDDNLIEHLSNLMGNRFASKSFLEMDERVFNFDDDVLILLFSGGFLYDKRQLLMIMDLQISSMLGNRLSKKRKCPHYRYNDGTHGDLSMRSYTTCDILSQSPRHLILVNISEEVYKKQSSMSLRHPDFKLTITDTRTLEALYATFAASRDIIQQR